MNNITRIIFHGNLKEAKTDEARANILDSAIDAAHTSGRVSRSFEVKTAFSLLGLTDVALEEEEG
jgi:hypothetical protein